jgi:hypothetical protein
MSNTIEIIDRGNQVSIVRGPMVAIPRVGDTVALRGVKYTVDEVVFSFDEVKGLMTGQKAELAIRIYVTRRL